MVTTKKTDDNGHIPLPPVEEIAQAIADIGAAARKLMSTRLTERAIITLLHDMSGQVKRSDIQMVLHNLQNMDRQWLKPLPKKETK